MNKHNTVSLHGRIEVVPDRDRIKAGTKPFWLSMVFDYVEYRQEQPYGDAVAYETFMEVENEVYFMDGVDIPHAELQAHLDQHFPELDIDELVDKIVIKAVDELHNL